MSSANKHYKPISMRRVIDEHITELSRCEIFVFGSNLEGHHGGGAAWQAYRKFGAEWGVGVGPTGRCYAIPTMHGGIEEIKPYVDEFTEYARRHPNNRFLVTRVGCGIAGFKDEQMAPLFREARKLPNVNMSLDWLLAIDQNKTFFTGVPPEEEIVPIPDAVAEDDLIRLCETYRYVIGSGVKVPLPKIRIRYVLGKDKFGYADFGDFVLREDGTLYVWANNEDFEAHHDQKMVEEIFEDECKERRGFFRKALFAGVRTPFCDNNGRAIYTGDVLNVWCSTSGQSRKFDLEDARLLAIGTLGHNEDGMKARYACVHDNYSFFPEEWARAERCGTVFYKLSWDEPRAVNHRCGDFQDIYSERKRSDKDKRLLAKYTPNFDQEMWKYRALEVLGIEFDSK